MADFFVDFSLSSNGDGSSSSPWNQLTSTETTTVSGGDSVWFRRTSVNNKLVEFKAGLDDDHRISYIGWPKDTDTEFYDDRPTDKRSAWDGDSDSYVYQYKSSSSDFVSTMAANTILNRFRFKNTYTSYSNQRGIKLQNIDNVTFYITVVEMDRNPSHQASTGTTVLYINNCSNIEFNDCYLYNQGSSDGYLNCFLLYIIASNINFNNCYFRPTCNTYNYQPNYNTRKACIVSNSTIDFNTCDFTFYSHYGNVTQGYSNVYSYVNGLIYFDNTTTTASGITISAPHSTLNTGNCSWTSQKQPIILFEFGSGCTTTIQDVDVNFYSHNVCAFRTESPVTISDVGYSFNSTYQTILLLVNSQDPIYLSNVDGGGADYTTSEVHQNYVLAVNSDFSNIHVDNIAATTNKVLDVCRSDTTIELNNSQLMSELKILFISHTNVSIQSETIKNNNFTLRNNSYSASNSFLYKTTKGELRFSALKCTTDNELLKLNFTTSYTFIDIANCKTTNTSVSLLELPSTFLDDCSNFSITSIRNSGYNALANIDLTNTTKAHKIITTLNTFDLGKCTYHDTAQKYSTSAVYREGGADYSILLESNKTATQKIVYPLSSEQSLWANATASGTFNITMHIAVIADSYTLASGTSCLELGVINEDYTITYYDSCTLMEDNSATWSGILVPYTTYKLITTANVDLPQYVTAQFQLTDAIDDTTFGLYIDPQLDVVQI